MIARFLPETGTRAGIDAVRSSSSNLSHMSSLPKFREFTAWLRSQDTPPTASSILKKLYRARARYKVARTFRGLRLDRGTDALVRGYSTGVRLFLCYSASEAFGSVFGKHVTSWEIHDVSLQTPLRRIALPLPERNDVFSKAVIRDVSAFVGHEHDNLRVVATALRHLVAHGDFTPTGTGMMTKSGANAISRLGDHLLAESERRFAAWFENLAGE